jgi:hypothetical protein
MCQDGICAPYHELPNTPCNGGADCCDGNGVCGVCSI